MYRAFFFFYLFVLSFTSGVSLIIPASLCVVKVIINAADGPNLRHRSIRLKLGKGWNKSLGDNDPREIQLEPVMSASVTAMTNTCWSLTALAHPVAGSNLDLWSV